MHVYVPLWALPGIAACYLAVGLLVTCLLVGGGLLPWPEPENRRWYHWPILAWLVVAFPAVVLGVFVVGMVGLYVGEGTEPECTDCDDEPTGDTT